MCTTHHKWQKIGKEGKERLKWKLKGVRRSIDWREREERGMIRENWGKEGIKKRKLKDE